MIGRIAGNGTDIKVQQELLRHSNVQTTLQMYMQSSTKTLTRD